jgi:hypothetical protein
MRKKRENAQCSMFKEESRWGFDKLGCGTNGCPLLPLVSRPMIREMKLLSTDKNALQKLKMRNENRWSGDQRPQ